MTADEKAKITHMRLEGVGFVKISTDLGISVNTIKSYCRRKALLGGGIGTSSVETKKHDSTCCKQCGKRLAQKTKCKPKKFCSENCRRAWWKANNSGNSSRKAFYRLICACCGKEFESYGNSHRKYCDHSCYIVSRFGGEDTHDTRTV